MCQLTLKCDQLFETQLRDVKVIRKLKLEIDHTKQNFHGRLRSVCLDTVQSLCNLSLGTIDTTSHLSGPSRAPLDLEKVKGDSIKLLTEAITNRAFNNPSEVTSRVNDSVKSYLKHAKLEFANAPTPATLEGMIQVLHDMLTSLEDCLESVVLGLFYQKVSNKSTQSSAELSQNILFVHELVLDVRGKILAEIEKFCNTHFSKEINYEVLSELCQVLHKVQKKHSEDVGRMLTSKLTETQISIISKEVAQKMTPSKKVNLIVDDLFKGWVVSYYQKMSTQLKHAIDVENWSAADLEDNVADMVQYISYLGNLPPDAEPIIILRKHVVISQAEKYNLTASYVVLLQVVHEFFTLIFKEQLGSSAVRELSLRLLDIVTVETTHPDVHSADGEPHPRGQGAREEGHREDLHQEHFHHHHGDPIDAHAVGRQVGEDP